MKVRFVNYLSKARVYYSDYGYAVDADSLKNSLEISHINLNDGTVEELRHKGLPIMAIHYNSEASPSPRDNLYMFERFLEMVGV